jgi:hypothetical protein
MRTLPLPNFPRLRFAWLVAGVLACSLCGSSGQASENPPAPPPPPPVPAPTPAYDHFALAFETGVTFGIDNPNHYIVTPQLLTLRWQPKPPEQFFHTPFTFSRQWTWTVEGAAIPRGPENYYFGMGPGVRAVYSKPGSHFSLYFDGRFIVGDTDSSGPPSGQGEDLTFSALVGSGLEYEIKHRLKVGLGCLYEHFSNGGLSDPVKNVGLNTVGPKFEFSYAF